MKKYLLLIVFALVVTLPTKAQFAKPLKSNKLNDCRNNLPLSLGLTGSYGWNDMIYTATNRVKAIGYHAPTLGLAAEYNAFNGLSVGLEASYAMRGTRKESITTFLTDFSTTTTARVNYEMTLRAIEAQIPVTYYLGSNNSWKPYVYLAPRVSVWLGDSIRWERTYDNGSYTPVMHQSALNKDNIKPYDIGAMAGLGLCSRMLVKRTQLFVKFDVSYCISVLSNFSNNEVQASEASQTTFVFEGWGDIEHENLGRRYLQNVEARLTLLIPLRKHLKDACAFDQRMKKKK